MVKGKQSAKHVESSSTNSLEETVLKIVNDTLSSGKFLQSIVEAISERVTELVVKKLEMSLQFNTEVVADLTKKLENKEKEMQAMKEDFEARCDALEQYSRRNSIRIFGVHESAGENTDELAVNVFRDMGVNVDLREIDRTHRVGPRTTAKVRPIIVKFTSFRARQEVFTNKRKLKGTNITIREDLSAYRLSILKVAIQRFGLKNVWSSQGDIIIKRPDDSKVRVNRLSQLPN